MKIIIKNNGRSEFSNISALNLTFFQTYIENAPFRFQSKRQNAYKFIAFTRKMSLSNQWEKSNAYLPAFSCSLITAQSEHKLNDIPLL